MAGDTREVSRLAGLLKKANPPAYEQFLKALDAYVFSVLLDVVQSPADSILQAQGRAQQVQKFVQVLTENLDPPSATS